MTPGEVVGEALRTRRLRDGWTAEQAAERATISYPTWRRLERGQQVRRGNMDKIDELYGLPSGATARAVDDAEIAERFAATLNPRDVTVRDAPGGLALHGHGSMGSALVDGVRVPTTEPEPAPVSLPEHDQLPDRAHDALLTAMALDRQLRELARLPNIDRELLEAAYRISYHLTRELPVLNLAAYARDEEVAEVLRRIEADERRGDQERDQAQSSTG